MGRSMAGSVAAERHLWLNLTEIREKEKVFLLDAPISQSRLFGEAVSSVMEIFRSAKTQSAALKQFMPRRTRDHSTPSSSLSREQSLHRKEPSGRSGAQAAHPPPTTVWGARGRPFPHQRPRRWVDLKRPSRPATSAPLSRSWPSSRDEESFFTATRRDQTAKAYLPASNTLSSLRSVTPTPRGLVCRKSPSSFFFGLAVGGRVGLSPSTVRPSATSGPHVRRHNRFSPTAYGPRADHLSVQCFTLLHPKQGRRGLSFVVEGVTSSRPCRHPKSGMSSSARHLYRISFTNGSAYQGYRFGFSVSTCRRLLGLMAAASPVLPLGLLHMRPFLWWMKELRLHPTIPATRLIRVLRSCFRPLLQWRDPAFLQSGVRMGAIHCRHMITTDASMMVTRVTRVTRHVLSNKTLCT